MQVSSFQERSSKRTVRNRDSVKAGAKTIYLFVQIKVSGRRSGKWKGFERNHNRNRENKTLNKSWRVNLNWKGLKKPLCVQFPWRTGFERTKVVGSDLESDRECRRTRKTKIYPAEDGNFPEVVENKRKTCDKVKLQRRVPLCGVKCTNSMIKPGGYGINSSLKNDRGREKMEK